MARLASFAISRAAGGVTSYALARPRDSPRKFGRDLLALYEALAEYGTTASRLASHVEQMNKPRDSELDRANELSERLSEIVGQLIDALWPVVDDSQHYERAAVEMLDREPRDRAKHRGKVIGVVDPCLAELMRAAYVTDIHAIWLARQLNALYFSRDRERDRIDVAKLRVVLKATWWLPSRPRRSRRFA